MKIKCLGCGIEKDTKIKEVYPFEGDAIITDEPTSPLFAMECVDDESVNSWRLIIVCSSCIHALQPDMWISKEMWETLNPVTPFDKLPVPFEDIKKRFDVEAYYAKT